MSAQLRPGDAVGVLACSDTVAGADRLREFCGALTGMGLRPRLAAALERWVLAESDGAASLPPAVDGMPGAPASERVAALMEFYAAPDVRAIFDISGGDIANELLGRIDYPFIAAHPKPLFGYSDLTAVLNAVHVRAGAPAVLYPALNLVRRDGVRQRALFQETVLDKKDGLLRFPYVLLAGDGMSGPAVGGNLRCFLKLAGTGYMPDLRGKILVLESLHGTPAQVLSGFCQLAQLGAFDAVAGVLLGTFTALGPGPERVYSLLRRALAGRESPVAATPRLGHGADSLALVLGREYVLKRA